MFDQLIVARSHAGRGLSADSEEKREPASDIDTVVAESLNALTSDGRLEKQTARIDRHSHGEVFQRTARALAVVRLTTTRVRKVTPI